MIFLKRLWLLVSTLSAPSYFVLQLFVVTPITYFFIHSGTRYSLDHSIVVWPVTLIESFCFEVFGLFIVGILVSSVVSIKAFYPSVRKELVSALKEKMEILFPSKLI